MDGIYGLLVRPVVACDPGLTNLGVSYSYMVPTDPPQFTVDICNHNLYTAYNSGNTPSICGPKPSRLSLAKLAAFFAREFFPVDIFEADLYIEQQPSAYVTGASGNSIRAMETAITAAMIAYYNIKAYNPQMGVVKRFFGLPVSSYDRLYNKRVSLEFLNQVLKYTPALIDSIKFNPKLDDASDSFIFLLYGLSQRILKEKKWISKYKVLMDKIDPNSEGMLFVLKD